ncbi:MAG: hypothetical protein E6F99_13370 [Actinobacteria bacterium]|nr:MAG: hypothetical protein E6F99_13370 [Actinomycetota bacterium]
MALLTAPASSVRPEARVRSGGRLAARARSTPGRLTALMLLLVVLGLLAGIAAAVGIMQRSALVGGVRNGSGALTIQAQQLYRSLSDADATAATAFLSGGVEPVALRQRYLDDISDASAALAAVTAGAGTDRALVDQLSAQLPVYTGLVDTARTYNRLGIPLGAAYLREASGLMRTQLLPAAQGLYRSERNRLSGDLSGGAAFPWLAVPLLLVTIAGLVLASRYLTRRTQRLLNVGLVVAIGAAALMLGWTMLSWVVVQGDLDKARTAGSDQVDRLASARIAALTARADEALTLVARGSGGDFDKDFNQQMITLIGDRPTGLLHQNPDGSDDAVRSALTGAADQATKWNTAHKNLRDQDNGGNYPTAVKLAISGGAGSTLDAFSQLDRDLATGIDAANDSFDTRARAAADGFTFASPGLIVLTLVLLAGVVAGLQLRIAEYR